MEDALGQAHVARLTKTEALNSINLIPSSILPGKSTVDQIQMSFHTPEPLQQKAIYRSKNLRIGYEILTVFSNSTDLGNDNSITNQQLFLIKIQCLNDSLQNSTTESSHFKYNNSITSI